jgi:hypothetical protein
MTLSLVRSFALDPHPTVTLSVGRDAGTFALAGGPRVDLRSLGPMRRLFGLLVAAHCERPARSVTIAEIFDVAWSTDEGARMSADARRNRVYIVISKLRRAGLSDVLMRTDAGYRLDPCCLVLKESTVVARPAPRPASGFEAHRARLESWMSGR